MTKRGQIYKCETCGNLVEVVGEGVGTLVCCEHDMTLMEANTVDAAKEKHVPVVEVENGETIVKVGEVAHPMEDAHYIEWVEIMFNSQTLRHYLKPGDKPEASFDVTPKEFTVRAYCNLHGLWKTEK